MRRLLALLRKDRRGVATIELALYAPILATMTIGVIDMSNAFARKLALEQAAQRAIEKVMQTTGVQDVRGTIIDEAADQANIPDDEKADKVTVTFRLECDDDAPQTSNDADTFDTFTCPTGTVNAVRYIQVEVRDTYEPMFSMHFAGVDADGTYHINALAGMRTQ
ncbi:MAG TPA: TadE/TadG family type IV pilus assembly protein [Sphingomicrobium sp.]|nr:TadE/TadG family type IV pilus assembly protein [Sphingomicrobium sp.]